MPKQADPLTILKKRRMPAVVLLDHQLHPCWRNGEAATLMAPLPGHPDGEISPLERDLTRLAADLVSSHGEDPEVTCRVDIHLDGDAVYGLRADMMWGEAGRAPMVMVQVDTVSLKREVDFDAVRRRYNISRREQDVLRMLFYGKSNKEIAELLFISEYTVKDHIKAIMAKMEAGSRSQVLYKLTTG